MNPFLLYRRWRSLQERRRRAHRFGIDYKRDKDWKTPLHIEILGKQAALMLPDDLGTRIAFKDIFISEVYGLERLDHPPSTILDIGAHVGLFSLAARLFFPAAEIHAYEPNPALWSRLDHHAKSGRFTAFPEAIAEFAGRAKLHFPGDSVFTQCVADGTGAVHVTSLHHAIERLVGNGRVDLLKLDCEGGEWGILADETSMRRVDNVTMEYHLGSARQLDKLITMLKACSFEIHSQHSDGVDNGRIQAARK